MAEALTRGDTATRLLHAAMSDAPFPQSVAETPENQRLWRHIQQDIADMPDGVLPDIPYDYNDEPDELGKAASDPWDPNPVDAEHVVNQMRKNYPDKALGWMKDARWIGPVQVDTDRVDTDDQDSWAASQEPDRIKQFAKAIKHGTGHTQPIVAVQEPGESRVKVIDGHHRFLAYKKLNQPATMYVGFVHSNGGPWDETHSFQVHQGDDPANKALGIDVQQTISILKRKGDAETLREYWTDEGHGGPTHGAFAKAIAWGTPGDFDRCVAMVTEHAHMTPEHAKGYCNLLHHRALGIWPATHAKEERAAEKSASGFTPSQHTGMVSLDLPPELLPKTPGGVDDHHVTLAYLGSDVDDDYLDYVLGEVQNVAAKHAPVGITLGGPSRTFPPSEATQNKAVAYTPVKASPQLKALQADLSHLHDSDHAWTPHVTLAYQDEGDAVPGSTPVLHLEVPSLTVHRGGMSWQFPLHGNGA